MAKLEVASGKAVKTAINWYESINDWFKSFGIVTGGLAASLADWVFGTITMSVLLSRYPEWQNPYMRIVVGAIFSLALWGIQIILWQLILTGQITKISNNRTYTFWVYVIVFLLVIAMKFGDDISDLFGVYWMVRDNPMKDALPTNLYSTLLYTILFLAWIVCGFSEVIMALSINLLKSNSGEPNNQSKPKQDNQPHQNPNPQFRPAQKPQNHSHGEHSYTMNPELRQKLLREAKEKSNKNFFGE